VEADPSPGAFGATLSHKGRGCTTGAATTAIQIAVGTGRR